MARRKSIPSKIPPGLSKQQRKILKLAQVGLTNNEIAQRLKTTANNVNQQLRKIRQKCAERTKNVTARYTCAPNTNPADICSTKQERAWELARQGNSTYRIASLLGISMNSVRVYKHRENKKVVKGGPVEIKNISDLPTAERHRLESMQPPPLVPPEASFLHNVLVKNPERLNNQQKIALAHAGFLSNDVRQTLFSQRARTIKAMAISGRQTVYRITDPIKRLMGDILTEYFQNPDEDKYVPRNKQALGVFWAELKYRLEMLFNVEDRHGEVYLLRRQLRYQMPAHLCLAYLYYQNFKPCTPRDLHRKCTTPVATVEKVVCDGVIVNGTYFKPRGVFIPNRHNVFLCGEHTMLCPGDMVKREEERLVVVNWHSETNLGIQEAQVLAFNWLELDKIQELLSSLL